MLYIVAQLILTTVTTLKKKKHIQSIFWKVIKLSCGGKTGSIDLRELFESENRKGTRKIYLSDSKNEQSACIKVSW